MLVRKRRTTQSNIMYTNAVYFPNGAIYNGHTPAQLNYSCINLVYYAFAGVSPDGHVFLNDEFADVNTPCDGFKGGLGSLMQLRTQHPHLQVVLSIGGAEFAGLYPEIAADPLRRYNFASSALALIEASGLDGIDINWVYPCNAQQGADFLSLLMHVRMYLTTEQYFVSASLPAARDILQLFDLAQVAQYVDLINLAAYDFYGPWSDRSGHHAQLYAIGANRDAPSASASVQLLLKKGVPAKKILLGVPLYGRIFPGAAGPNQQFAATPESQTTDGTVAYYLLPAPGTLEQVDRRAVGAYCSGGETGFVSYDNPETVKAKAEFCKQKSLNGLYYWSSPSDNLERRRNLITTGFKSLHDA